MFFFLKEKTIFYFLFFKTKLTCSYQTRTYWLVNEQKLFCDSSKKSKAVQYSCFGAFETFIEHSTQSTCYSYNYVPFGNVKLALPMPFSLPTLIMLISLVLNISVCWLFISALPGGGHLNLSFNLNVSIYRKYDIIPLPCLVSV